jgi:hypothetical protein
MPYPGGDRTGGGRDAKKDLRSFDRFSEIGNLSESAKSLALTPPLRANVRSLAHYALQSDVAGCLKRANITALNIIQNAQLV